MRQKNEILKDLNRLKEIISELKTSRGNHEVDALHNQLKKDIELGSSSNEKMAEELDNLFKDDLAKANLICSEVINSTIREQVVITKKEIDIDGQSPLDSLASHVINFKNSIRERNQGYIEALTTRKIKLVKLCNKAKNANPENLKVKDLILKIQIITDCIEEINSNLTALTISKKRFLSLEKLNACVTIEPAAPRELTEAGVSTAEILYSQKKGEKLRKILNKQSKARKLIQTKAEAVSEPKPVVVPVIKPVTTPEIEVPAVRTTNSEARNEKPVANKQDKKEKKLNELMRRINETYTNFQAQAQISKSLSFTQVELRELCLDDPVIADNYSLFQKATRNSDELISKTEALMNSKALKSEPGLNNELRECYATLLPNVASLVTLNANEARSQWKSAIIKRQNSLSPFPGSPEREQIEAKINAAINERIKNKIEENRSLLEEAFGIVPNTNTLVQLIINSQDSKLTELKKWFQAFQALKEDPTYRRKIELSMEKNILLHSLQNFLNCISEIHLVNGEDNNTQIFAEALIKNLQTISTQSQADNLPLNISKVADFYRGLINKTKQLLDRKKPGLNITELHEIQRFLTDLNTDRGYTLSSFFNTDSEDTILKKQIRALRSLNLTLVDFTEKTRHDYNIIKAFQDAQNPTFIFQEHKKLKTDFVDFGRNLTAKLALFPQADLFREVIETMNLIEDLNRVASKLDEEHEEYLGAMKELANQNPGLNASLEAEKHAKLIEARQNKALDRLNTYRSDFSKHYDLAIKSLDSCYNTQKNSHITNLQKLIDNADITLSLIFDAGVVGTRLSDAREELDALIKDPSTKTIGDIEQTAIRFANDLERQIDSTRITLQQKASRKLETLKQGIRKFQLSDANPYTDDLMKLGQELDTAIEAAGCGSHYYVTGSNITQDDKKTFKAVLKKASDAKQKFHSALSIAKEVEKRIQSKEYQTSLTIIKALDSEFLRIFDKKTQKKLTQNNQNTTRKIESEYTSESESDTCETDSDIYLESDSQEIELINLPENRGRLFLSQNSLDNADINALNAIDPRLGKLWTIRNDFREANSDYINKKLDFKALTLNRLTDEFVTVFKSKLKVQLQQIEDKNLSKIAQTPSLCITERNSEVFDSYKQLLNKIDPSLVELCMDIRRFGDAQKFRKPGECYVDLVFNKIKTHLHNDQIEHISDSQNSAFTQFLRVYVFKPWRELKQWVNSLFSDSKHHFFTTFGATKTEEILVNAGNEATVSLEEIQAAVAARESAEQEIVQF